MTIKVKKSSTMCFCQTKHWIRLHIINLSFKKPVHISIWDMQHPLILVSNTNIKKYRYPIPNSNLWLRSNLNWNLIFILGQSQNPHAVSGQLQASLLQPFNIGSHYTHPVSYFLPSHRICSTMHLRFIFQCFTTFWMVMKVIFRVITKISITFNLQMISLRYQIQILITLQKINSLIHYCNLLAKHFSLHTCKYNIINKYKHSKTFIWVWSS